MADDSIFILDRITAGFVRLLEIARDKHPEIWDQSPAVIRRGIKASDLVTVETPAVLISANGSVRRVGGPRPKGRERLHFTFTGVAIAEPKEGETDRALLRLYETVCKVLAANRRMVDVEGAGTIVLPDGQLTMGDGIIGVTLDEPQRGIAEFDVHATCEFTCEPLGAA